MVKVMAREGAVEEVLAFQPADLSGLAGRGSGWGDQDFEKRLQDAIDTAEGLTKQKMIVAKESDPGLHRGATEILISVGTSVAAAVLYDLLKLAFSSSQLGNKAPVSLDRDTALFVGLAEVDRCFKGTSPPRTSSDEFEFVSEDHASPTEWSFEFLDGGFRYELSVAHNLTGHECRVRRRRLDLRKP